MTVFCLAKTAPKFDDTPLSSSQKAVLHVLKGYKSEYENAVGWNQFTIYDNLAEDGTIIKKNIESIQFAEETLTIAEGHSYFPTMWISPLDADATTFTWSSSNESVAIVDEAGTITGAAPGEATIPVKSNDELGANASVVVYVVESYNSKLYSTQTGSSMIAIGTHITKI